MKALFRQNKHLLFFLLIANLLHTFGHSVWRAMFNNFAVERIGVGADAIGWIQSVRELPGLLAFVVAFLALIFKEMRIMAVSLILLGIGIIFTGQETINHISAVIVPVVGGTIWILFGAQAPFLAGVGIAVISLLLAQLIRTGNTESPEALLTKGG